MNASAKAAMARAEALIVNASMHNPEWVRARNETASDAIGDLAVQAERWQIMHNETLAELEGTEGEVRRDRISEFFKNRVARFVWVPLHRAVLIVVFLVWLGVAIWQASLL